MADRSVAISDTLNTLRTTYNSTAGDVGDISGVTGASGTIASSTDIVEAIVAMNTEIAALKAGTSVLKRNLHLKVQQQMLTKLFWRLLIQQQTGQ